MAHITDIGTKEFYIIFLADVPRVVWYDVFISNEFKHVLLVTKIDDKQTLIIDPLIHCVSYVIKNHNIDVILRKVKSIAGSKIIKYNRDTHRRKKWRFRGFYTCVNFCKTSLNIWCLAITPKQLYKYLLRKKNIVILKG